MFVYSSPWCHWQAILYGSGSSQASERRAGTDPAGINLMWPVTVPHNCVRRRLTRIHIGKQKLLTLPLGAISMLCSVYPASWCHWHVMFSLLFLLVALACNVLFTFPLGVVGMLCSVCFSLWCCWHVMFCLLFLLMSLARYALFTFLLGVVGMLCSVYSSPWCRWHVMFRLLILLVSLVCYVMLCSVYFSSWYR